MRKPLVLVLCYGNVNRSPLAAAVLAKQGVTVVSAGFTGPGRLAAKKTRDFAAQLGYDLSIHRSQLISKSLVKKATHILVFGKVNYERLHKFLTGRKNITLAQIPDPVFLPKDSIEFKRIQTAVIEFASNFVKEILEVA